MRDLKRVLSIKGCEWSYLVTKSLVKVRDNTGKTTTISREKFHDFATVTPADVKRFILNGLKPFDYSKDDARAEWERKFGDGEIFADDDGGDPLDPEDDFYPEHAKLQKVKDESQTIGEFLDWLTNERPSGVVFLCERHPTHEVGDIWVPFNKGIERLLAEYFEIDEKKLESEKRQIQELAAHYVGKVVQKTIGKVYAPAMKIDSEAAADSFVKSLVDAWETRGETKGKTRDELEQIARSNVTYFARYYDDETVLRIEHVFKTGHPIFGKLVEKGHPSPEAAFQAGVDIAQGKRKIEV